VGRGKGGDGEEERKRGQKMVYLEIGNNLVNCFADILGEGGGGKGGGAFSKEVLAAPEILQLV
jgi:hypothetical protein